MIVDVDVIPTLEKLSIKGTLFFKEETDIS